MPLCRVFSIVSTFTLWQLRMLKKQAALTVARVTMHLFHCKFHIKAEPAAKKKKKDPSALSLLSSTCKSVVCKLMTTLRLRCQVQSVSLLHQPQTAYWCNVVSSVHDTKLYNDGTTSQHSEKRVAAKCSHIRAASHWHMKESGVVTSCYSHFIPDYI